MAEVRDSNQDQRACFVISVAARLVGVHEQTLRYYERAGLLKPARSRGDRGVRLYSLQDLQHALQIRRLMDELGVNLAGVEVIMRLTARVRELEEEVARLKSELEQTSGNNT